NSELVETGTTPVSGRVASVTSNGTSAGSREAYTAGRQADRSGADRPAAARKMPVSNVSAEGLSIRNSSGPTPQIADPTNSSVSQRLRAATLAGATSAGFTG